MSSPLPLQSWTFADIRRDASADAQAIASIWNEACGEGLAISPEFAAYNMRVDEGVCHAGWLARADDAAVGFVLASQAAPQAPCPANGMGWIDALAVRPENQQHGLGTLLLAKAEAWLAAGHTRQVRLGGNLRPFVPGLPAELTSEPFFRARGYRLAADSSEVWDVAANLAGYDARKDEVGAAVRPAQPGQAGALLAFLDEEFPGRWRHDAQTFLDENGRLSDFMLLWTEEGLTGFCQITFEDSARPLERYYPYALPRPWGQLGAIGVRAARRGEGLGAALLDAGLRRLRDNGVNGCIIDWTEIPDFYAKFGFQRHRRYLPLAKVINGQTPAR